MVFGTRDLKCWVLGPSGIGPRSLAAAEDHEVLAFVAMSKQQSLSLSGPKGLERFLGWVHLARVNIW